MGSRRGHGEGSIYQRASDGLGVSSIDLGYLNGKRKRKPIYGKTRKEVAEKLKVLLRDQQQGLPIATERQTVGQYLTHWLTTSAKNTLRGATYVSYESYIRVHLIPAMGRIQLTQLGPQHIQSFINDKLVTDLSPSTVLYGYAILRRALGQALKLGLVPRNVATLVDPPRVAHLEVRPWSPEEARAFLDAMKGDRLEALYSVALSIGLRRGEALGLRWADVNLEAGTITVRVALQRLGGKLQLVETKTNKSRRTIPLPATLVAGLKSHRKRQIEERLRAGTRWQETGMVFASTIGTPSEPRNINRSFYIAMEKAGLTRIRFHDFRHTCATLLLVQGVAPRVVMEILGHSKIAVTIDTYSHVLPAMERDAANRMETLLFGS